ncbi:hypothetical protein SAMN05444920_10752 [Nonomuraea solani]|uniref:Uncharacterized protein n=1 Tax=Nonomuraea solani TaxID=1144553 RepID=A0A1H6E016_9ACTN|nr:hypothetical protein [Nonomuraea solani]SEG90544.1 hypothetical protein SAMN05444920_10752 [Nonomuraea solani]
MLKSCLAVAAAVISLCSLGVGPAAAATCSPQAPTCTEVRGTPGAHHFWFRFQPAPATPAFTLTLNGIPASGGVSTYRVGTALEGEFRPSAGLVTGDKVCVRLSGSTQDHCATTP